MKLARPATDILQEKFATVRKELGVGCRSGPVETASVPGRREAKLTSTFSTRSRTMAIPHALPGEVIDVRPLGAARATAKTSTLLKTERVEIIRLVMAAGKVLTEHKAPGEITVHCLEGKIAFTALGQTHELTAGQLLFLPTREPHSVVCVEDASFLLTILLPLP